MVIKYILYRNDLKAIKLYKIDFNIIFRALVVEIKNQTHTKLSNLSK